MDIFTVLIHQPIYNLLVVLYRLFGENLGLAIMGVSLLIRLVLYPIAQRQTQMSKSQAEMNTEMEKVRKQYSKDEKKQAEELVKVQGKYTPGILVGCFGLILQLVVLITMYHVVTSIVTENAAGFNQQAYSFIPQFAEGERISTNFFGIMDLSSSASLIAAEQGITSLAIIPYVIIAILVGLTQYFSGQLMMSKTNSTKTPEVEKTKKSDKNAAGDFSTALQQSMQLNMKIFPVFYIFTSLSFPAGLSLYWTVQSAFVIIQQLITKERLQSLWKLLNIATK